MNIPQYFSVGVYGKRWGEVEQIGTKVFENHPFSNFPGLTPYNVFADLIFTYAANYDLQALEQELISRGFGCFERSSLDEEILKKIPLILCDKYQHKIETQFTKTEGLEFLNKELPTITSKFSNYMNLK